VSRIRLPLGLLLLGVASGARAQTPEERAWLARLEQRAAAFATRRERTDSLALVHHDTLRVGPLLVLTDSAAAPVLRTALDRLRAQLIEALGTEHVTTLEGAVLVVRFGPPDPAWGRLIAGDAQFIQAPRGAATPQRVGRQLAHGVQQILMRRGGRSMTAWRADLRLFEDPTPLLEATYIELVTSHLPGARQCFQGLLAACGDALRIVTDTGGPPLDQAEGLPAFVEQRYRWRANEPALARPYAACVGPRDPGACVVFLDLIGAEVPSLSTRARGTVLLAARNLAGADGVTRFFADSAAALVPRLEAAAGVPLDSLLAGWRATILAHRPPATSIPAGTQWLAVASVLGLAALATRSTRWR